MAWRRDNSGIDESCPSLDAAISGIEDARKIASELRAWGNEQYQRAEEAEGQCAEWETECDGLRDEIKDLKAQLAALQGT